MTKIAGALNMLPKTILNKTITNESTNEVIKIYQADRNYPKFGRKFKTKSFGEIISVQLSRNEDEKAITYGTRRM
jgi:hypothetical protein